MLIDAPQHFWKSERNDYGWITPEIPVLYRDYCLPISNRICRDTASAIRFLFRLRRRSRKPNSF